MGHTHELISGTCSIHERDQKYVRNLSGNQKRRDPLEDPCVDESIILKWVLNGRRFEAHLVWRAPVVASCEEGNDPSGSIKGGIFLHWLLSDYCFLSRMTLHALRHNSTD